jgi:hypothetical protein
MGQDSFSFSKEFFLGEEGGWGNSTSFQRGFFLKDMDRV